MSPAVHLATLEEVDQVDEQLVAGGAAEAAWMPAALLRSHGVHAHLAHGHRLRTLSTLETHMVLSGELIKINTEKCS